MKKNNRPHNNCYWLLPGLFMAGEYPLSIRPEDSEHKLATIIGAGIRHFIDLTESCDPLAPYEHLLDTRVSADPLGYDRFPIPDMGLPSAPELTNAILDRIDQLMEDRRTLYVHCWGGIGRTGTIVGCWLVRHGMTGDAALAEIAKHWQLMEKRTRFPRSPQTDRQLEYVLHWSCNDSGPKCLNTGQR